MNALTVGVVCETAAGERRVALTPDAVARLRATGLEVTAKTGGWRRRLVPDSADISAGARVAGAEALYPGCDVLGCVHPPGRADPLRAG